MVDPYDYNLMPESWRIEQLEVENERLRKTNAALVNLNDIVIQESKRKVELLKQLEAENFRLHEELKQLDTAVERATEENERLSARIRKLRDD